ncbi:hypothetical protein [Synechococcus sp. GFB01]|uniref:hypothetical protein n=1 Tax=Synechococcus sp. GFB01 TaxID=1662190 RepID=UPI001F32E6F8|nr:hypothetical protein [Synechococcus sp. GFB01]
MSLAPSLPIALLTLLGGGLLSILVARIAALLLGPLVRRTRSSTDDWILQVVVGSIPSFGWVLSAVLAWRILPTSVESDRLALDLDKLLHRQAARTADAAVASMLRSLSPLVRALTWGLGAIFYLQNIGVKTPMR